MKATALALSALIALATALPGNFLVGDHELAQQRGKHHGDSMEGTPTSAAPTYLVSGLAPRALLPISASVSAGGIGASITLGRTTTTTPRVTTTSSKTTAAAAKPTQTLNVSGLTYQNAMLQAHNLHRSNHSIPLLAWDAGLASTAQVIAASCVYAHNVNANGGGYGQNIGAGAAGNGAAGLITNLMYNNEINYYPTPYGNDNPDLSGFSSWGHYSQLVWTETTKVGCYTQYCPLGLANTGAGVQPYFTVCNYSPPGNYVGEFSQVAAPRGGNTYVVVS